jgi:hypothetical protein
MFLQKKENEYKRAKQCWLNQKIVLAIAVTAAAPVTHLRLVLQALGLVCSVLSQGRLLVPQRLLNATLKRLLFDSSL